MTGFELNCLAGVKRIPVVLVATNREEDAFVVHVVVVVGGAK